MTVAQLDRFEGASHFKKKRGPRDLRACARYGAGVNREDARRLAHSLRDRLWTAASADLLARLTDRGGLTAGLNPSDESEDEELVELVWQALQQAGLASEGAAGEDPGASE